MHHLILQLFICWLSLPCNNKVANEENEENYDSGDDDDDTSSDDDDSIDWYQC